ncbi:MAG: hypothetical protein Q9180_003985 [Flavoplaca navasiana]
MAPLMPGNAGLESIGSVAANFARQDAEEASTDFRRWMDESPRSSVNDSIVSEYGPANYAEFAAWERVHAERGQREDEARRKFRMLSAVARELGESFSWVKALGEPAGF